MLSSANTFDMIEFIETCKQKPAFLSMPNISAEDRWLSQQLKARLQNIEDKSAIKIKCSQSLFMYLFKQGYAQSALTVILQNPQWADKDDDWVTAGLSMKNFRGLELMMSHYATSLKTDDFHLEYPFKDKAPHIKFLKSFDIDGPTQTSHHLHEVFKLSLELSDIVNIKNKANFLRNLEPVLLNLHCQLASNKDALMEENTQKNPMHRTIKNYFFEHYRKNCCKEITRMNNAYSQLKFMR